MPDNDFEWCPVGTMALLESLEWSFDDQWCQICKAHERSGHETGCKLSAILKAHRDRMGVEPAVKESLTTAVASRESRPTTQPDYTSETEDLTTWPATRGPEWRRMGKKEIMRKGDVFRGARSFQFISGLEDFDVGFLQSGEAWTRRPPQTKGEG